MHSPRQPWSSQEADAVAGCLTGQVKKQVRVLTEGHCLQIVAAGADKAAGVRKICAWLGIPLEDIYAAGDSKEDLEMMQLSGSS